MQPLAWIMVAAMVPGLALWTASHLAFIRVWYTIRATSVSSLGCIVIGLYEACRSSSGLSAQWSSNHLDQALGTYLSSFSSDSLNLILAKHCNAGFLPLFMMGMLITAP